MEQGPLVAIKMNIGQAEYRQPLPAKTESGETRRLPMNSP